VVEIGEGRGTHRTDAGKKGKAGGRDTGNRVKVNEEEKRSVRLGKKKKKQGVRGGTREPEKGFHKRKS